MSRPANTRDSAGFTFSNHGSVWLCEPDADDAEKHLH
jgi:hypothetical protein